MRRFAPIIALLFAAPFAFAAGGTCPSGANYINPASPAGSLVTLSSLGITNCYFVGASGSDSNSGTTESSPFLHAPGMTTATSNALAVWNATVQPGTGIILRGGDTWHQGNSGASPYTGGTWGWNNSPGPAGNSSHPIYVGVDPTWFSGPSFSRPILTWDNPTTTSQTLASCTYPSANSIDFSGGAWFIFDDMELTGVCANSSNWNPIYVSYGSLSGAIYFERLYLHGSSHVGFPNPNNCTASSTCMSVFRGSVNSGSYPPGDVLLWNVADFSDSDPVPMEGCYCGMWEGAYNYFNNISQFITRTQHILHDNTVTNFVDNGHANVMESVGDVGGAANTIATYNNTWSNLYVGSATTSNVCFWPSPPVGQTHYFFNNTIWNAGPCELFNIGENFADQGTVDIFNTVFQNIHRTDGGSNGFSCSATGNADPYANLNIQFISDDVSTPYASNCSGKGTDPNYLLQTNSAANSAGYTGATNPVYAPQTAGAPTVGTGSAISSPYCSPLSTAAGTDSSLSDAAMACSKSTRYGVVYNSGLHTLTSPGTTSVGRTPGIDKGPYQYTGGVPGPPVASVSPSSLAFGSQTDNTTSGPKTVTITNTGTASLLFTGYGLTTGTQYSILSNTCASTFGNSLPASSSCAIQITFTPLTAGSKTDTLTLTNNSGGTIGTQQTVGLSGTGISGPTWTYDTNIHNFTCNGSTAGTMITCTATVTLASGESLQGAVGAWGFDQPISWNSISGDVALVHPLGCSASGTAAGGRNFYSDMFYVLSDAGATQTITVTLNSTASNWAIDLDLVPVTISTGSAAFGGCGAVGYVASAPGCISSPCVSPSLSLSATSNAVMQATALGYGPPASVPATYTYDPDNTNVYAAFAWAPNLSSIPQITWDNTHEGNYPAASVMALKPFTSPPAPPVGLTMVIIQ